ncbi:hypothetical protein [Anaerovibrio sp. JC8]|uniref:hypothetical protein n=1 Tax=Anaerovibrio sp. JC8 TaxID=1240085 RepID=UPI000A0F8DB0|nr:hypothetical protein [Anaerovibrio sp. JC8]
MEMEIIQYFLSPLILLLMGKWLETKIDSYRQKQEAEKAIQEQAEKELQQTIELLKTGTTCILRDRILQSCNYFNQQGHITPLALENITRMHEAYKSLGGNGLCDRVFSDLEQLEVD